MVESEFGSSVRGKSTPIVKKEKSKKIEKTPEQINMPEKQMQQINFIDEIYKKRKG